MTMKMIVAVVIGTVVEYVAKILAIIACIK